MTRSCEAFAAAAAGAAIPPGCLHCGSPRLRSDDPAQRWELAGHRCALVRCDDCGGLFTFPLPPPSLIERLYKEEFNYRWYADHYPAKFLDALHRVVQYRRLGVLGRRGQRVLDYGGGLGYFAHAARVFGYAAQTCDPMYELSASGAATGPRSDYEVIACHHVLEHAIDPGQLLRDIGTRLAAGGRVLLAVPNAGGRGYREQRTRWVWCQPPLLHIHHFTARGLRALVERAGFRVESAHFFDRWDASAVADLTLAPLFRLWDGRWQRARWPWAAAQVNSLGRLAALLAGSLLGGRRQDAAQRAELVLLLGRGDAQQRERDADGAARGVAR